MSDSKPASGIQTFADGQAYIPSSKRADGSTRKEIKIRPGYKPPEDVEKYKSRSAETWRTRGAGGVPGVDEAVEQQDVAEAKSKNAKRREAARKKKETDSQEASEQVGVGVAALSVKDVGGQVTPVASQTNGQQESEQEAERQKKIRNQLKKLKAIRELKSKRVAGEKLTADQLVKMSKEQEIVRDLIKLDYSGPELEDATSNKEVEPPG